MAFFHWRRYPFLRILPPFVAGICMQWYLQVSLYMLLPTALVSLLVILSFYLLTVTRRYKFRKAGGFSSIVLFFCLGAVTCHFQDIRNHPLWAGHPQFPSGNWLVTVEETPVEKPKSVKVVTTFRQLNYQGHTEKLTGTLILYLKKDSSLSTLKAGDTICFSKSPQLIQANHNPGAFDFYRYSLFRGITHQLYLNTGEYVVIAGKRKNSVRVWTAAMSTRIAGILRKYIPGAVESGLAEALLIGYKNDLDPELAQTYSNTGTVHIIAISGMHLGLIYGLLLLVLRPLRKRPLLHALLIICSLWTFSLMAGGQPSVLRSALMFSCLVAGQAISRKANGIHALSVSAFILLCYNPFWLWDPGFQLSYCAVLSIMLFMKPVYQLLYLKNQALNLAWKMNSVTIAAQWLTIPVSIYHFHQFPVWFLISNFIAVPLSGLILYGEILLLLFSLFPPAANLAGIIVASGIRLMNSVVKKVESLPFAVWDGLQLNTSQTLALFVFTCAIAVAWLQRSRIAFFTATACLLLLLGERAISFVQTGRQQQLIVYNIPGHTAIDFISGHRYFPVSDSAVLQDKKLNRMYLQPARTLYRLTSVSPVPGLLRNEGYISFYNTRILFNQLPAVSDSGRLKQQIDCLILSGKNGPAPEECPDYLEIKQLVIDGSVPLRMTNAWKKHCGEMAIPCHSTAEKGAFVFTLN